MATAHDLSEPTADAADGDLDGISVQVTGAELEIDVAVRARRRTSDKARKAYPVFGQLAGARIRVCFTCDMTTTSSRTLATEAITTPGARCLCRMCAH
ncbi:hypothetical protein [Streptomyces sp. NPDC059943]|uniref:hypothetical protein n=1 Tax=Streptomyces sp. NPDC059943 TaxID=3347010 RepID=UPI003666DAC3